MSSCKFMCTQCLYTQSSRDGCDCGLFLCVPNGVATARRLGGLLFEVYSFHATPIGITLDPPPSRDAAPMYVCRDKRSAERCGLRSVSAPLNTCKVSVRALHDKLISIAERFLETHVESHTECPMPCSVNVTLCWFEMELARQTTLCTMQRAYRCVCTYLLENVSRFVYILTQVHSYVPTYVHTYIRSRYNVYKKWVQTYITSQTSIKCALQRLKSELLKKVNSGPKLLNLG